MKPEIYIPASPDMDLAEQARHARGFAAGVCRNDHHTSRLLEQLARSVDALINLQERLESESAAASLPISEPWLREQGAKWDSEDECWCFDGLRIAAWTHEWRVGFGGRDVEPWKEPTRANFFALLRALGISTPGGTNGTV